MSQSGTIIILGASLLLQMVADELARTWPGEVIPLTPYTPDIAGQIRQLNPAVVIVERAPGTAVVTADLILQLLYDCPDLPIVGLDTTQPVTYKLSGARLSAQTVPELVQALAVYQAASP
jgi:hypothetical protein